MDITESTYKNGKLRIVATITGKYAGEIRLTELNEIGGYVSKLGVTPKYRNNRIATILLNYAQEVFENNGCKSVRLHVDCHNVPAINLYEKNGYFIICKIKSGTHYLMAKKI